MAKVDSPSQAVPALAPGLSHAPGQRLINRFRHNRVAMIGLLIVIVMTLAAVFGPLIAPHNPDEQFRGHRLESPGQGFLLGTDNLGRDLLSRLLHGARLSIGMSVVATVFIVTIAVSIGALAGYAGGLVDDLAMRAADVLLAFPGLILALAIVGILGPSLVNVIISLAIVGWASYARLVRGLVLEVREQPFVEAALSIGASRKRILLRHIIPNVISPVIVLVSLEMGALILATASTKGCSRTSSTNPLSIGMSVVATVFIVTIAVSIGALAGYAGGLVDDLAMRAADVLLAFPGLILALAIVGILGPSLVNVIISLAIVGWASYARLVRGLVLEVREQPFVEAALSIGASRKRILLRHIIPNVISPVIVLVSLEMGALILAIAGLNFLGLGVQPPTAEWGAMLNQGRLFFQSEPQLMIYPGIMISLTVLGFNLLGDGLRDVLDLRYAS